MATKTYKLDIFKLLSHISKKDMNFYNELDEQEQKGFVPTVTLMWLAGTNEARQVFFLNELVNPFVFTLYKHPKLLYNLMTCCTSGTNQRYRWIKSTSKKDTNKPESIAVIKETFKYSTLQALEALPLLSNDDILEYAADLGTQKDVIAKIKRELKKR